MPESHEQDSILVTNPDLDCPYVDSEGWAHKDGFQVKWGGVPHTIRPGETRRFPRFVAEHFAKHLTDHILQRREAEEEKANLVQNQAERSKTMATILLKVEDYFHSDKPASEGEKAAAIVEQLNPEPEEKALDLGEMPPVAVGAVSDKPVVEAKPRDNKGQFTKDPKTSIFDPKKPKPSREALIESAEALGIEVSDKDTDDQIVAKLKAF